MNGIFGKTSVYEKSRLVLIAAPWEVSVSYGSGTASAPLVIQKASRQLDFFNPQTLKDCSKQGIYFKYLSDLKKKNDLLRPLALKIIEKEEERPGSCSKDQALKKLMKQVNRGLSEMVEIIKEQTRITLEDQKLFGLIGGDHSVSEGALREIGNRQKGNFSLLHIDAHADMRKSYQGMKHSHASVMYNVFSQKHPPHSIVQLGLRDISEEEYKMISTQKNIHCFFDYEIKKHLFEGKLWTQIVDQVLEKLSDKIYISLDMDGLSWPEAPHTGCPVPGGLSFEQVSYLFHKIGLSRKTILGFDVVETGHAKNSPLSEWDGNVASRLIYQLSELSLSQKTN